MNTANPEKLVRVIQLLMKKKIEIDLFMESYIFRPYGIDIAYCIINHDLIAAKKLLDFSFSTRQGGQNKAAIQKYENDKNEVMRVLNITLDVLKRKELDPRRRNELALAYVNSIFGIGQKISTMFLKFLVYYSADFEGKECLDKELFIPLDSHVIRSIYAELDGERTKQLNLYAESISQAALKYEWHMNERIVFKENKLLRLQRNIQDDFGYIGIKEPPIVLDYLWYVGTMYCRSSYGDIGCKVCFLKKECEQGTMSF